MSPQQRPRAAHALCSDQNMRLFTVRYLHIPIICWMSDLISISFWIFFSLLFIEIQGNICCNFSLVCLVEDAGIKPEEQSSSFAAPAFCLIFYLCQAKYLSSSRDLVSWTFPDLQLCSFLQGCTVPKASGLKPTVCSYNLYGDTA